MNDKKLERLGEERIKIKLQYYTVEFARNLRVQ